MTHLTATIAATATESIRAIDQLGHLLHAPHPANAVFFSPVANCLELPRAAFHYSVISVDAMNTLAPGLGDRHIPFNGSAAPNTRGDVAGVRARADYESRLNSDQTGRGLEPAEEKAMQTAVVLPPGRKSTSRTCIPA